MDLVVVVDDAEAVGAHVAVLVLRSVERDPALVLGVATGATPLPVYRALARGSGGLLRRAGGGAGRVRRAAGRASGVVRGLRRARDRRSRWASRRTTSWCHGGAARSSSGRIAELGGDRRAAARDRPQRAPGLQRAGVAAGLAEPGGGAHASTTRRRQRGVLRRTSRCRRTPLTQGLGTILEARHLVLLASGAAKAEAVAAALTGPVTPDCPASVVSCTRGSRWCWIGAAASALQRRGSVDGTERERVHHPQL